MPSSPFVTVETDKFSVTFTLGADDNADTVEDADAVITAPSGARWSASLMTLRQVREVMTRWTITGESLNGHYFQSRDLVILREGGLDSMVNALADIFEMYGMETDVLPRLDI
ncbi:hypothetical protein ACFXOD_32805 [Streptomyces sp. NPDC059161]|uniref:hypothetical protein n=1 Tax=Streptomyces sp. NPDC059161 TaxID=3346749 RepID=UPI00369B0CE1